MALRGYEFEPKPISLENFDPKGRILDLGAGGEGVIGLFGSPDQVSIDMRLDELREAPMGPQKVVMDARQLALPYESLDTVTAFFSLMYINETSDLTRIFNEAYRVLRPTGILHIWDVNLPEIRLEATDYVVIQLEIKTPAKTICTGYGAAWPDTPREEADYIRIAEQAGFRVILTQQDEHTLYQEYLRGN
ncbi:class I SAM-dependent methyltransferase [bacterium]|nr:class I SAM-dependent methyltransferase [bacterium]